MTATYPAHREATVMLRDGSTLAMRPVRLEDEADLARFFTDLSMESRVFAEIPTVLTPQALHQFEDRDRIAGYQASRRDSCDPACCCE